MTINSFVFNLLDVGDAVGERCRKRSTVFVSPRRQLYQFSFRLSADRMRCTLDNPILRLRWSHSLWKIIRLERPKIFRSHRRLGHFLWLFWIKLKKLDLGSLFYFTPWYANTIVFHVSLIIHLWEKSRNLYWIRWVQCGMKKIHLSVFCDNILKSHISEFVYKQIWRQYDNLII